MATKIMIHWIRTHVMGIEYRYLKDTNLLQRKYIYKKGWETMPIRPNLATGRAEIIAYIMKGGDTAEQSLIKTAKGNSRMKQ